MTFISIFSFMLQFAFAQITFEQTNPNLKPATQDKSRAVTNEPSAAKPMPATPSVVESPKVVAPVVPTPSPAEVSAEASSQAASLAHLRKRQHRLNWDYVSGNTKTEVEGSPDVETDSGTLEIGYGYNFGYFEVGAGYGFSLTDDGTDQNTSGILSIYGRLNIIENKPGNDLIPFIALGVQGYRSELDSTTDLEFTAGGGALQLGLSWFPLGEIYAVELAFFASSVEGDVIVGASTREGSIQRVGLSVGYSIFF